MRRARIAYRYLSGRPLFREPTGGYLHRGGREWWPGWGRQAVRVWLPGAVVAGEAAAHPVLTEAGALAVAAVAGPIGVRRARRWWRMRRFHREYTRPTLSALRPALGDAPVRLHIDPSLGSLMTRLAKPMSPAEQRWREWYGVHVEPAVRWLPDRMQRAAWAVQRAAGPLTRRAEYFRRPRVELGQRIQLDTAVPYLTVEQRQLVSSVVTAKIPGGELIESWDQVGRTVTATWTVRKRPPAHCGYADLDARFADLGETEFFLGLGADGRRVVVDLHSDSPHIAISAGSGAGKSVLAQLVAVQVLARRGTVTILDIKGSHRWALNMPGVDYCYTPEQMHRALIKLSAEADERNLASRYEEEGWVPGERRLVVAEELNVTMARLRSWWEINRPKGAQKIPPAVEAHQSISAMGRSAWTNEIAVAQMLTSRASGGPEARENYGIRALARFTANNWKMLCPNTPMPRASRTMGRWQIVVADVATETQVCYLTTAEAKMFVHKHRPAVATPAGSPLMGAGQEMSQLLRQEPAAEPPLVTLQQAAQSGVLPWKYGAARQRLKRRKDAGQNVPEAVRTEGTTGYYRPAELIAWAEREQGLVG